MGETWIVSVLYSYCICIKFEIACPVFVDKCTRGTVYFELVVGSAGIKNFYIEGER